MSKESSFSLISDGIAKALLSKKRSDFKLGKKRNVKTCSFVLYNSYFNNHSDIRVNKSDINSNHSKTNQYSQCMFRKVRNICHRNNCCPSLDVNTKDGSKPLYLYDKIKSRILKARCNKVSCQQSSYRLVSPVLPKLIGCDSLRNYRLLKTYESTSSSSSRAHYMDKLGHSSANNSVMNSRHKQLQNYKGINI
jgi:hypothetical protein